MNISELVKNEIYLNPDTQETMAYEEEVNGTFKFLKSFYKDKDQYVGIPVLYSSLDVDKLVKA